MQIDVKQLKEKLDHNNIILIDVRTPEELSIYGKISNDQKLINIYDASFTDKIQELDKTKKYLIYCAHGNRSKTARDFMSQQGFKFVQDLKGGIEAWKNEGEKVLM